MWFCLKCKQWKCICKCARQTQKMSSTSAKRVLQASSHSWVWFPPKHWRKSRFLHMGPFGPGFRLVFFCIWIPRFPRWMSCRKTENGCTGVFPCCLIGVNNFSAHKGKANPVFYFLWDPWNDSCDTGRVYTRAECDCMSACVWQRGRERERTKKKMKEGSDFFLQCALGLSFPWKKRQVLHVAQCRKCLHQAYTRR